MTTDIELILQYIFDSELDDFNENPSDNHIYYIAYRLWAGEKNAKVELQKTLNFRKEIDNV